MLILSNYKVALHPSYLKKIFSFIIFIKERYRFKILWGTLWAELKSDEHLRADHQQNKTFYSVSLTVCSYESWPGSFIAGTAPSFGIKRYANPASNWALFIKVRQQTQVWNSLLPRKTNCIHSSCNSGLFGKLNKDIFPFQPKTHFFGDIFPGQGPCIAVRWSVLRGALLLLH